MKWKLARMITVFVFMAYLYGCSPKYGCPSNGKNVGAERILSGEKVPKAKPFRQ